MVGPRQTGGGPQRLLLPDARSVERFLRVSWHPDAAQFVVSTWDGDECLGTVHVPAEAAAALAELVVGGLDEVYGDAASGGQGYGDDTAYRDQADAGDPGYAAAAYGDRAYGDASYGDAAYGDASYGDRAYGDRADDGGAYGDVAYGDQVYGAAGYGDQGYGERAYGPPPGPADRLDGAA